jgi:RecA-family ATPase
VARRNQIPDLVNSASKKFAPDSSEVISDGSETPTVVSISDLATFAPTPPAFWAEEILPADVVTLLSAHGGAGKTTLALYAAVCFAMGLPFLGKETKPANVLFYSAEDDRDLLRWRLATVCQRLDVDPVALAQRLRVVDASESDSVLFVEASRNGVRLGEPTTAFKELKVMVCTGAQIVIIDNASDVYGADENNRGQVRAFIRLLAKLVRPVHGAVLLLAHVDKLTARVGGSQGYSGSTAWHNSVRSRLFLSEEGAGLKLEHQKSNRGKKSEDIHLLWEDGLPVLASPADAATNSSPIVMQSSCNQS